MSIPPVLHPFDEHVLTAKAMAFSVLEQHAQFWTDEHLPLLAELEAAIGTAELLRTAARENVALTTFLKDYVGSIDTRVRPLVKKSPELFDAYLDNLQGAQSDWSPITQQADRWFDRLKIIGADYLQRFTTEKTKMPPIRLEQKVSPQHCTLRGLGGVTDEDKSGRIITLFYDREAFGKHSFPSIPYILSHEFWCHGLSRLVAEETRNESPPRVNNEEDSDMPFGTDPANGFEEGWMDFVQLKILERELHRFTDIPQFEALFHSHSTSCQSERNSQHGNAVVRHGVTVAERFYSFLEQSFDSLTVAELDAAFLGTSLDLNLLSSHLSDKPGLVIDLGYKLGVSAARERIRAGLNRDGDVALVSRRAQLRLDLAAIRTSSGFPPHALLKLLKIKR